MPKGQASAHSAGAADKEQARQKKMAENPGFYDDQGYWYTYAYDENNGYWDEDGNYYYGETTVAEDERLEAERAEAARKKSEKTILRSCYKFSRQ